MKSATRTQSKNSPESLEIRQRLKDDFEHYAGKCLKIRTKAGDIRPLVLNQAQQHIHSKIEEQLAKTGRVRVNILKGRQQGCSTYVEGRFYWKVSHRRGVRAFILTHEQEATNNLFEIAKRFHDLAPKVVKPSTSATNAKELSFNKLDSGYKIGTAGTKGVGRSQTNQYFHGSEVAFWPHADEHAKGVIQSVPDEPGTEIIRESTANGIGNYFHQQWQLSESRETDYINIFVPWYWQEEYTKPVKAFKPTEEEQTLIELFDLTHEQLAWRRAKIVELSANGSDGTFAFRQEYPCTPEEAFQTSGEDSLIKPEYVLKARKCKAEAIGPHVVGVDPARFGDDRTSIIHRKGRVAFDMKSYEKKDTMEVAGLCHKMIEDAEETDDPIDKMFIDVGGLGAGVVDRLRELGHDKIVVAVNGGEKPLDAKKYHNKRAEMWGLMSDWLKEQPCDIPNSDSLHSDLCGPSYSFDSNSRLVLEKKDHMKKRGLRSPDEGDALALTFARPVKPKPKPKERQQTRYHGPGGWMS